MYQNYLDSLEEFTNEKVITQTSFKRNEQYRDVLEHVSDDLGRLYLEYIQKDFAHVCMEDVIEYVCKNDAIGNPYTAQYTSSGKNMIIFECSPSSLRYVYHALLILDTMRNHSNRNLKRIVELGCGYGGLFLAIKFFRDLYFEDVTIDHYLFIDFPQVLTLTLNYLKANKMKDVIALSFVNTLTFVEGDIENTENDLFLVSNYCFTELSDDLRDNYFKTLVSKVSGGFIIWQTIWTPLSDIERLPKPATHEVERPQTSGGSPNYFVRF